MEFVNTIDYHRHENDQSLEDYYSHLRIQLSRNIIDKNIIYLDTKFWVLLRDSYLSPSKNSDVTRILRSCLSLHEDGKCIFPISEDVFIEVMKQTDLETLKATIFLIDKLSNGISLISYDERIRLEIMHFWRSNTGKTVHDIKNLIWTKLAYLLGFHTFYFSEIDSKENSILQKALLDQMWTITLSEAVNTMEKGGRSCQIFNISIADKLNEGKFKHQNESNSFHEMFVNEVVGLVDAFKEDLAEMMKFIYEKDTGGTLSDFEFEQSRSETVRVMGNVICNIFRLNKAGGAMPTIRISAALYAAIRWDKKQKFQDHDIHDIRHAAAALPFCDYFFTERRLAHLVTQNQLGFDKLYNCKVESRLDAVISTLDDL